VDLAGHMCTLEQVAAKCSPSKMLDNENIVYR
jgi:hypothetical protein